MGMWDWVSSWFKSNKHTLSREQQIEIQGLLDRMKREMEDNINAASTNTSRRLQDLIQSHDKRLSTSIEDSKNYFNNEITRISDELKNVKMQLNEEEKKKKKKEDAARENKLTDDYQKMLDIMKLLMEQQKLLMEQQKSNNSSTGPSVGFPPHPGYGHFQPSSAPGYQNASNSQNYFNPNPANQQVFNVGWNGPQSPSSSALPSTNVPPSPGAPSISSGIYPNLQLEKPATNSNSVKDSPKKLVLPDKRDYEKYGIEHEGNGLSNVSKKLNSSKHKLLFKNRSSVVLEPTMKDSRRSSLGQLKSNSKVRLMVPDIRLYGDYDPNYDPETNLGERYSFGRKKSTSKSSAKLDSQLGCGLILPDSRDYNKIVSASIQKKLKDEEFEKMLDNFSQEFRPGSKSNSSKTENKEKRIADNVKNFFLKDNNELNKPKQRVSRTSASNASVKEWLQNTENFDSDDNNNGSDSSEVSVRTDLSKFSSVSATSGKRVFWNKSGNYGKPTSVVGSSSQNKNRNKPFEPKMNKGYANDNRYSNQNRYRNMKKEYKYTNSFQKDKDSNSFRKDKDSNSFRKDKDSNSFRKDKDSNSFQKDKDSNFMRKEKHSNSMQKSSASMTSVASSSGLSEIHYPSKEEAYKKSLDLFKPLDRNLVFLGKNEDDKWITHEPKCLNDIYHLEKQYTVFRTIEIP